MSDPKPLARALPPVDDVIARPAPRPEPKRGEDARVFARRALDYGDENAATVEDGRAAYADVARRLATPEVKP